MTLAAGTRLGPYEILSPIGAGGMGEVFRARDPRLSREVAIKVLPTALAQDADRLRRFEQEARAAGALNHPNLTAIYDVGRVDGTSYLVEELLEGETLRAAFAGGRFAPRKAIGIAVQIAQGLAAAHGRGIVHRDLKPENVFVTKDGRVKILDFGLAKLAREAEATGGSALPTEPRDTDPGTVMGTLGYMSPEQVRGQAADARSDIFALGAILYEMLAGQRAFRGDSAADTMSAILREDPPDLSVTNKNVAPGLERVVRHCLEKSPEQRFQSARDVAFDLETLSDVSAPAAPSRGPARLFARRVPLAVSAGAVLAALAIGALAARALLGTRAAPPTFTRITFRRGMVQSARFSPDGSTIVYGAAWDGAPFQLFAMRAGSVESRSLGVNADLLSVSRGGELAVSLGRHLTSGFESSGTLARLPLDGGAPRQVMENVAEADWTPDGKDLLLVREVAGRYRIELPIGKVLYESPGWISDARLSPDGGRVAFLDHPQRGDNFGSVCVVDRAGRRTTLLPKGAETLAFSPDGREVWATVEGALLGLRSPGSSRVVASLPGDLRLLDVQPGGRALLAQVDRRRETAGLAPGEAKERSLSWFDWTQPHDLTEDGSTLLFDEQHVGVSDAGYSLYVRKTDGSLPVRLGDGLGVALSRDGRWALAVLHPFGDSQLELLPTGPGEARTLPFDGIRYGPHGRFLSDGRSVLVVGSEKGHPSRLWRRALDGSRPRPVTPEDYYIISAFSPDDRSVAATGPDGRMYVCPLDGGAPRPMPGAEPGEISIGWARSGEIIVMSPVSRIPSRITRIDPASGRRTLLREIAPSDPAGVFAIGPVLVVPDGSSYVYSYRRLLSTLYLAEGLK